MRPDITLYFVTDSTDMDIAEFLHIAEYACIGGATLVQLREKSRCGRDFLDIAKQLKKVTDKFGIPLIINDRLDIALACGADGVHLGQEDIPINEARKILGVDKIIGATAKTVEQAVLAEKAGADYLGAGAIFPSVTKDAIPMDVETLKNICRSVKIPVCAIGGINYNNCDILNGSGISGIAAVSAITKSSDPQKAVLELKEKVLSLL